MIVHSKDFVTNLDEACIQPNAVDLRIESMERLSPPAWGTVNHPIHILEDGPKEFCPRASTRLGDITSDQFYLQQGYAYDIVSQHQVTIPEGMVGWLIIRSTFARNGCLLGNGLYDSGYSGVIGGIIHNLSPRPIIVARGTRFAQFVMASAETAHLYSGHYNQNGGLSQ